jgi:hypothetical protein
MNAILSNSPETKNFKRKAVLKNYGTHEIAGSLPGLGD